MLTTSKLKSLLSLAALAGIASACGAPVKSSTEVASIFSGDAVSLESKLTSLCSTLRERSAEPTLKGSLLSPDGCDGAGAAALNLQGLDRFQFLGLDDGKKSTDKVIHFSLRAELWLNRSLIDLAGVVGTKLKAKNGQENKGALKLPDGLGKAGGPLQFSVNIIDEPKIDTETFHFSMKLNFKATGIVSVDNTMIVGAQMIDGKVAAHAKTTDDMPIEKSLLKNAEALVTVIPHANDIYVDALIDANIYSPLGVADDLLKSQAEDMISGMLKPAIDSLLNLNPDGGG